MPDASTPPLGQPSAPRRWTPERLKTVCMACAMVFMLPGTALMLAGWAGLAELDEPTRQVITFLQLTGLMYASTVGLIDAKPIVIRPWRGWARRLMPLRVFGVVWVVKAATILGWAVTP